LPATAVSSTRSLASVEAVCAEAWIESLSPWPVDGFGLDRMWALLEALGSPQHAFPAIHVVGTNGKSTATRTIEALLLADGFRVGSTISPHVSGWPERIRVDGREVDFDAAIGRIRAAAEQIRATQFETLTAAALAEFAAVGVDVAVVEAGLGGRHDATNVLRTKVVLLTNVSLDHTEVLGETVEEIAEEKLAVAHDDSVVVVPDRGFESYVPGRRIVLGGAREAAEMFAGHPIAAEVEISLPGRLERRENEIRDGAHNLEGVRWLVRQLTPGTDYVVCASILRDKNADAMLAALGAAGARFVATQSSNVRALPAGELAELAQPHFAHVEVVADPEAAIGRAHELGEPILVTGSLYLLADLAREEKAPGR
jgi:dihydrofolate synthase / folylpolyglutamate synthase